MSGLGWAAESSGQGAFENIQKLMQTRIQQAQVAEQARANIEREKHDRIVEENASANDQSLALDRRHDNALATAGVLPENTPIGPPQQAENNAMGLGGLMRTRPLNSSITTPNAAIVPDVPDMNARAAGVTPTDTSPGLLRAGPIFAATQMPNAPGQPGDMLSVPTEANRRLDETARIAASDKAADNRRADSIAAETARYHTGMINKPTGQPDARMDKSYQLALAELEKKAAPLAATADRYTRLVDTVNQKSPQADALIAPELLVLMAGGQGSGLRINEAEIKRVISGRNEWQDIQAAVNKWQTDPTKALSVTDAQRADIGKLLAVAHDRLSAKVDKVKAARYALVNSTSVDEHRKIMADLEASMTDTGTSAPAPDLKGLTPGTGRTFHDGPFNGQTWTVKDGQPVQVQ